MDLQVFLMWPQAFRALAFDRCRSTTRARKKVVRAQNARGCAPGAHFHTRNKDLRRSLPKLTRLQEVITAVRITTYENQACSSTRVARKKARIPPSQRRKRNNHNDLRLNPHWARLDACPTHRNASKFFVA
jgi:hypothetical protein